MVNNNNNHNRDMWERQQKHAAQKVNVKKPNKEPREGSLEWYTLQEQMLNNINNINKRKK